MRTRYTVLLLILLAALLAGCAIPASAPAAEPAAAKPQITHIRFALDWAIEGPSSPFLVALDKGYFAQEGLSVVIDRGTGSAGTVSRIAGGAYEMGYADINAMMEFNVKNPDKALQAIGIVYNTAPMTVFTLKDKGINTPQDLAGKKLGAPAGDAGRRLFPLFASQNGFDPNAVEWVTMEPALREVALAKGEVDAITAFYGSGWFGLTRNNVPPEEIITFMYTDYGLPLYGNAVMASPAYLAANAEAVKGFMRGLARGWQDSLADPAAAVEIIKRREPLVDAEVELQRLQLAIDRHFLNDEVRQNGFGAVDPARLARSIELVAQGFELSPVPTADSVFSDAYLPPKEQRMPPQ